ncbi:MAG: 4a-hydroxytetrahydrobiopterin dehydratase [Pseudomonadota bacterium]
MADAIGAAAFLERFTAWHAADDGRDAVKRVFKFADFKTAWAFMSAAALKAEQMDHHPEWFNVYGKVEVTLTTHDANGVTERDAALAEFMDRFASSLGLD